MATHFSTLAWEIPETEEPSGLGLVRHDLATKLPHIYKTPSYQIGKKGHPTSLDKANCVVNCLWRGACGRELEVASRT